MSYFDDKMAAVHDAMDKLKNAVTDQDRQVIIEQLYEQARRDALPPQLGIIGRDRALMDKLSRSVHEGLMNHPADRWPDVGWMSETLRGSTFEVAITLDGKPTGHVARIDITLDRVGN